MDKALKKIFKFNDDLINQSIVILNKPWDQNKRNKLSLQVERQIKVTTPVVKVLEDESKLKEDLFLKMNFFDKILFYFNKKSSKRKYKKICIQHIRLLGILSMLDKGESFYLAPKK